MKLQYLNPVAKAMVPQMNLTGNFSKRKIKVKRGQTEFYEKKFQKNQFLQKCHVKNFMLSANTVIS